MGRERRHRRRGRGTGRAAPAAGLAMLTGQTYRVRYAKRPEHDPHGDLARGEAEFVYYGVSDTGRHQFVEVGTSEPLWLTADEVVRYYAT